MTNFPGGKSSFNEPTADIDTISVIPTCFKASMFALKFIFDGDTYDLFHVLVKKKFLYF